MERKKRILIVDDDEIVRRTTRMLLERQGYEILTEQDGLRGLEKIREDADRIDLVLLDLSLPGMSGEEVLAELRKIAPRLRIAIFTGYAAEPEDFPQADGVLQKPFTMDELTEQIHAFLETKEADPPEGKRKDG